MAYKYLFWQKNIIDQLIAVSVWILNEYQVSLTLSCSLWYMFEHVRIVEEKQKELLSTYKEEDDGILISERL